MHTPPPDWNEDRKLWDLLAKAPTEKAGSNFLFQVQQKLQSQEGRRSAYSKFPSSPFAWLRGWVGGLCVAAACLIVLTLFLPRTKFEDRKTAENGKFKNIELASLAQHYELIQDLDVIEKLDEL